MRFRIFSLWAGRILPVGLLLSGCGGSQAPPGWESALLEEREAKDEHMRGQDSPLAAKDVPGFKGIVHFPPDPDWRFVVPPDRAGAGERVQLLDTAGQPRHYSIHSRAHITISGQAVVLTVYESSPGDLFLPFQDTTNGGDTYGAGRYLNAELNREGLLVVDFNRAYNPYCAYDDRWVCPLVPPENRLSLAVTAGEKSYH